MTRKQIQKKIVKAAVTLANGIKDKTEQPKIRYAGDYNNVVLAGEPVSTVGFVLQKAGFVGPRTTLFGSVTSVKKVLGVETLPSSVVDAVAAIDNVEYYRDGPYERRRAIVKPLLAFADAVKTANLRKPYTKSGKFTAAAAQAGTFGTAPAPVQPVTNSGMSVEY